ncbi:hypothetical protein BH10PLA2_BH10PLA2_31810 [soil metagenome]
MNISWISRRFNSQMSPKRVRRPVRTPRPGIEALEGRELLASTIFVVPLSQPLDVTHRHTLADAMPFAGSSGTIVIQPGATADAGPVNVTISGLTIRGDANAPGSILPLYDLNISGLNTTLSNMNLGTVTTTASGVTISRSVLNSFTETGAATGVGHNTISQNVISGKLELGGNSGLFQQTVDVVEHNTFNSLSPIIVQLTNSNGSQIRDNIIYGAGASQIGIQLRSNSDSVIIANNTVHLNGTGAPFGVVLLNTGGAAGNIVGAKVLNNVLDAGPTGTGLYCNVFGTGAFFAAQIEGNEFHGNKIGIDINGIAGATGAGKIDIGGGTNAFGTSKGGNNFRSFNGLNSHYAINLHNTDAGITVSAKNNTFDVGVAAGTVVRDGANGGGSGTIDVSAVLNSDRAFIQNLYTKFLGRTGNAVGGSELDGWVAQLGTLGRGGVSHNILYSSESLNRIVDGFYVTYLGRASGADERVFWVSTISGGGNIDTVEAGFISSPEFLAHSNTDYVQALYLNILGRTGGPSELAGWYQQLPQLGLQGVASAFTNSKEHREKTVTKYFENYLHREPVGNEAVTFAAAQGDLLSLLGVMLASDEFYNKV